MTAEQKEQQILLWISELPIFRRIRIAITILRGVEPEELSPPEPELKEWENPAFFAELDRRAKELENGVVETISGETFLEELRKMRQK